MLCIRQGAALSATQVPGMTTVRQSKGRDVVLDDGKLVIPRDIPIFMPIGALHRSHAVYQNADDFLPERWLASDADYLSGERSAIGTAAAGSVRQCHILLYFPSLALPFHLQNCIVQKKML